MPRAATAPRRHPIPPMARDGLLNVIVETPAGSRNKYAWDPALGLFALKKPLPAGASFPFDFGFIPNTIGATATRSTCWSSWTLRHSRDATSGLGSWA